MRNLSRDEHLPFSRYPALNLHSLAPLLAAALILGGCASVQPELLTTREVVSASAADQLQIRKEVEPLKGSLTLEEAIARAIKYNLEGRVRSMEEALAAGQLDVGGYDMLPKLVASAGYHERNNDLITRSKDSVTGAPSVCRSFEQFFLQSGDLSF